MFFSVIFPTPRRSRNVLSRLSARLLNIVLGEVGWLFGWGGGIVIRRGGRRIRGRWRRTSGGVFRAVAIGVGPGDGDLQVGWRRRRLTFQERIPRSGS